MMEMAIMMVLVKGIIIVIVVIILMTTLMMLKILFSKLGRSFFAFHHFGIKQSKSS